MPWMLSWRCERGEQSAGEAVYSRTLSELPMREGDTVRLLFAQCLGMTKELAP
jgi:hypothetical protein